MPAKSKYVIVIPDGAADEPQESLGGKPPLQAARTAKRRASEAVRDGLIDVGAGAGPVDVLGVT